MHLPPNSSQNLSNSAVFVTKELVCKVQAYKVCPGISARPVFALRLNQMQVMEDNGGPSARVGARQAVTVDPINMN